MGHNILTEEGKDKRGVTCLRGDVDQIPLFSLALMFCISIVMGMVSIFTLREHEYMPSLGFACACATLACMGRYYYRLRIRLSEIDTAYMIRKKLGMSKEEFDLLLAASDVKPVYCVNGNDLYDFADFGDKTTLLRASTQAASTSETLLRPASDMEQDAAEQLLRANAGGCTLNPGPSP